MKGLGDLHEGFDLGWEPEVDVGDSRAKTLLRDDGAMAGENVWPDLPGFKRTVLDY